MIKCAAEQHEVAVRKISKILSPDDFNTVCYFQPLNKIIAEHGVDNGVNVMGLDYLMQGGCNGTLFLAELGLQGAENEAKAYSVVKG